MPSPPVKTKFPMPPVKVGDVVIWSHDASRLADGAPGFVTKVGQDAIGLTFFAPDARNGSAKDGVRYAFDPTNNRTFSDAGVFDFAPDRKRLDALEARLKLLEATYTVTDDDGK
jgi:hypothetical protein